MRLRAAVVATVGVAVFGVGACGSSPGPEPAALMRRAADVSGSEWVAVERSRGPGVTLTSTCGDPAGLGVALDGVATSSASPVRQHRVVAPDLGRPIALDSYLRVAATRYEDQGQAERAMAALTPAALERCVVGAVNEYVDARYRNDVADEIPAATAVDIEARQARRGTSGRPAVVQSTFEEEVLGGYDNSRSVSLAVVRSDATVLTVVLAKGAQSADADDDARQAEDLAAEIARTSR